MLADFTNNLILSTRLALCLPVGGRAPVVSALQLCLAWIATIAVSVALHAQSEFASAVPDPYGVGLFLGRMMVTVLALFFGVWAARREPLLTLFLIVIPLTFPLPAVLYLAVDLFDSTTLIWAAFALVVLLPCVALVRASRIYGQTDRRQTSVLLVIFVAGLLVQDFYIPQWSLLEEDYSAYEAEAAEERPSVDVEALYYAQAGLMNDQLDAAGTGVLGEREVFALLVAGYAHQRVFWREVEAVGDILDTAYGLGGRVVTLANSAHHPQAYPMANRANLRAALAALGDKMDVSEDILFLFMTSHGSEDSFGLTFYEAQTAPLDPVMLKSMIHDAGIENVVMVLSACKSGSFLDDFAEEDWLVIAASAADRNSFGCSDENDWTYWGRAFFDQALRAEPDPRVAFAAASDLVEKWEAEQGHMPSLPMIQSNSGIDAVLDAYLKQR